MIIEGQRNNQLASKAGVMRNAGFTQAEIEAALLKMNADRCSPSLDEAEVLKIAKSIARYAPAPAFAPRQPYSPIRIVGGRVA
jgi:putative DNA primase/helicase